jgi:hypothetical protein
VTKLLKISGALDEKGKTLSASSAK